MKSYRIDLPEDRLRLVPGRMVCIDFETYSEVDIKETGTTAYAKHPTTEILLLCWSADEGKTVHEWVEGDPPPYELFEYIRQGYIVRAWNSEFERLIWENIAVPLLGWVEIEFEQWVDTAVLALTHALPGKLETAAKALKLKHQKDAAGTRLINKFSKPRKPTKKDTRTRHRLADFPKERDEFIEYCAQDVRTDCGVFEHLPRPNFRCGEERTWRMTVKMNERGIRLDQENVFAIQKLIDWHRDRLTEQLREITNDEVQTAKQRDKIVAWLEADGLDMEGLTKLDVEAALNNDDITEDARRVLLIRQELGQSAVSKYEKMLHVMVDSRTHDNMVYHRASTGRNGGLGLQMHNFPRDAVSKDPELIETCLEMIREERYQELILVFGNPFDVAKGLLRSMIVPDIGEQFYCADFSSVENIGTVWICQDKAGLDVFYRGEDQYKSFVAKQFNIGLDDVTDEQRFKGKATILGSMFGAGWKTVFATNQNAGVPMTKAQAKTNVDEFRSQYAVTAASWKELQAAVIEAVEHPGKVVKYKGLKFSVQNGYLWIKLHSGRFLAYYDARNEWVQPPWKGDKIYQTTAMGTNATGQWVRQNLSPSRIIENIVQATARDLLMYAQDNINDEGFKVLLNVHDEILSSQVPGYRTIEQFIEIMVRQPAWTDRLPMPFPLKADGYTASRYRK